MNATIKLENVKHFPVLLNEVISIISPLYGGTFIDCTFGQGGYSKKILENNNNKVYAIDRDYSSIKIINTFKKKYQNRFEFKNKKFSEILDIEKNIGNLRGIIFDLAKENGSDIFETSSLSSNCSRKSSTISRPRIGSTSTSLYKFSRPKCLPSKYKSIGPTSCTSHSGK